MNVLLVTHRYPPDGVGGVERYVEALGQELTACGDEVAVLTRTPTHWPRRPQLRRREQVYRIVGSGVRLDEPFAHEQRLERLTKEVIAATAPDIVHVNQLIGLTPGVIPLARAAGAVTVISLHDYYFACPLAHLEKLSGGACEGPDGGAECERTCFVYQPADGRWPAREARFRALLDAADVVVAPTQAVAAYFERHTQGAVSPVVVANGTSVPSQVLDPLERRPGELRLAVLGTVSPHKGAHVVIDALRLAALPRSRLALWGRVDDPGYEQQLRASAAAVPGLAIEFGGEYAAADLAEALVGADAVVVASQVRESSGVVPREALAYGVPPLVARIGGLPDTIDEGRNGLTFDPSDPSELAGILTRLALTPELLDELAEGARRTELRTIADHARDLRAVYAGALDARAA